MTILLGVVLLGLFGMLFATHISSNPTTEPVKREYQKLRKYVPEAAADYCIDLWQLYDFPLLIKGDRKTKLGDFRGNRHTKKVSISVNGTLNPHAFLLTYLHELAHLIVWQQHPAGVKPHGPEWQAQFQLLMQPLLNEEVFPVEVLRPLKKYMQRPAASTASCQPLWIALRIQEEKPENALLLAQVPDGQKFRFSNTVYMKMEKRRTRVLCQNLSNGRRYLISTAAQVEAVA